MFPMPAAARWSRSAAFTGARRLASTAASFRVVNPRSSGSPPNRDDALAGEGGGDRFRRLRPRQARIGDLDALEASSDEPRLEALANRLDLGEFGHDDARPSGEDVQHDGPRRRLDVADAVGACDL